MNDTQIEIAGKPVYRIIDDGCVNSIQTSITCPSANAKILCITQIRECDGKSGNGLKKGTQNLANGPRKQIISPESTCQPDSTSDTFHNAEQARSDQLKKQPSLLTATVVGKRLSCSDDLT